MSRKPLSQRLLVAANMALFAVQLVLLGVLLWQMGWDLSLWWNGGSPYPVGHHPATVMDSIQYWGNKPTFAVFVSLFLVMASATVTLLFPRFRKLAIAIAGVAIARHLIWRTFYTLDFDNPASAFFGTLLYFAELYGIISLGLGFYQMYRPVYREPPAPLLEKPFTPSVDILIPTYTEPLDVLFRTIVGCQNIDYPAKTVYILDDGKREGVRQLCQRLGCRYIRRPDNRHAKAGNLNYALTQTTGDLIVVFDADHVPLKTFLQRTVPYFLNSELGFVQTPQHFSTMDPFQRNLIMQQELSNEQDLFYHVVLPGMDAFGSVTFAGSGTVFRRKALDEIGGFAVETVTEDMHTGLRLHNRGWKSFYVNEDLSSGLAPENFGDFLNQRLRWGRGATQVFVIENPLTQSGLSLSQKLCYFNNLWYFLHGLPRVVFLLSPLIYLLFGVIVIDANFLDVLSYYLSFGLICSMTYMMVSGRVRQVQWAELYETVFCFYLSMVTLWSFFSPYKAHFKVTPKGVTQNRLSFEAMAVLPQIVMLALTLTGLGLGISRALHDGETLGYICWNSLWAGYNGMLLSCAILCAVNRPQRRGGPRVDRVIPVEVLGPLGKVSGRTLNISEKGLFLLLNDPVPVRSGLQVKLLDWSLNRQTMVRGNVVRSHITEEGKHFVALALRDLSPDDCKHMVLHTFTAPDTWQGFHQVQSTSDSIMSLVKTPLRWCMAREIPNRRIDPRFPMETGCVLVTESDLLLGIGQTTEISEMGASITVPARYPIPSLGGLKVRLTWPGRQGEKARVVEMKARVIRQHALKNGDISYGVVFTDPGQSELASLQTFLYHPDMLKGMKRVYGARNLHDARFRLWSAQTQERWKNVRFIQAGTIENQGQYVPFNINLERAPSLTENVIPLKRGKSP